MFIVRDTPEAAPSPGGAAPWHNGLTHAAPTGLGTILVGGRVP